MSALTPFYITGYDKGLVKNKKPFLLPDQAWETLENGYIWRDREVKREGNQLLGRLQRDLSKFSFFSSSASPWSFSIKVVTGYVAAVTKAVLGVVTTTYPHNLTSGSLVVFSSLLGMVELNGNTYTITVISPTTFSIGVDTTGFTTYTSDGVWISNKSLASTEPNSQIVPGSFSMLIGAVTVSDNGDGTLTSTDPTNTHGTINYNTGAIVLITNIAASTATGISYKYYPGLPGMAIWQKETSVINAENTIWWDTRYAYVFASGVFDEFSPGTAWNGNDSDFFWAYNYQQSSGSSILFVTNFNNGFNPGEAIADPMYFTDGSTWTAFTPAITASLNLYQALILIPYYGRLLALNTWEGTSAAASTNFFNRCRFSGPANGDPTASTAWRTDIFGLGGSIDAPVDESITGATFVKNTLIVDFEYSTWQLRYVGEYGLPFIWERVSSDYGSGSTFSGVLFDNHRLNVGDVAITSGNAVSVQRIDVEIPDQVFSFQNEQVNNGAKRVWGVRDFVRELIFWCYPDGTSQSSEGTSITYPNKILLYNYRNNTWAIFRDSVTAFGTFQLQSAGSVGGSVLWNSTNVFWDSETVTWDSPTQTSVQGIPVICKLNQQGYAHILGVQSVDDASLSVTGASLSGGNLLQLTIPNHNLMQFEIIYLTGMQFISNSTSLPVATSLNEVIYQVFDVIDTNTIQIAFWNSSSNPNDYTVLGTNAGNYPFTPVIANSTYVGGGEVALFPKMNLISKDINLFQKNGLNTKLSRIDFLIEPQPNNTSVTVNLILNSNPAATANILITSPEMSITNNAGLNQNGMEYQWFAFYQTLVAQYFRIQLTYDDSLMNTLSTHQSDFTLYAINAWTRPGGRLSQ